MRLLLETKQESALRVIQESGVLDRPDFYDAFHELVRRIPDYRDDYVDLAIRCPGFLESSACDHHYIVHQAFKSQSPMSWDHPSLRSFYGDYTALLRHLQEAGWRSTPSAVQQACESQPSFECNFSSISDLFQINLLTIILLARRGACARPATRRTSPCACVSLMLLLYAFLAGGAIRVHATLGTQGADPTGGWLFVAFLCIASVTIAVELHAGVGAVAGGAEGVRHTHVTATCRHLQARMPGS